MKTVIMCGAVLGALLFAGCKATNVPPPDRRVTIAPDLGTSIYVTDVRCTKGSSDCYTFQANVVNNTSSERAVEWKVVWLDSDGMEIDSTVSTWAARMIQPYEVCALKGTAPTQAAVDMMFYVRRAK